MQSISLVYIGERFLFRIVSFFRHWYVGGFAAVSRSTLRTFSSLDRTFAFQVTLRHFFEPLYQDRTTVGYVIGFLFRSARIVVGGLLYLFIAAIAILAYLVWAVIPAYLLYRVFI